ncbi:MULTISPECIES: hypothetical protein [unclassified Streptomyces]|uniref:hypothetical protein n=1 Tax=unclassified Streptomyces TaxID=2593676 RepID=UPI001661A476|nr:MULTISPECIES: hypothetical protein [unclassified Streptomyces]MBD0842033.1 hypothetical protein [Streptomyces sp. TRM68416]
MTARDTGIRVRAAGDVDEEALAYVRAKVEAALDRPGIQVEGGEVRVTRAAALHVELPWSAAAEVRVGGELVVVHAREASAHELADRLQDRLRGQADRAVHRGDTARRAATPPPWRGGPAAS